MKMTRFRFMPIFLFLLLSTAIGCSCGDDDSSSDDDTDGTDDTVADDSADDTSADDSADDTSDDTALDDTDPGDPIVQTDGFVARCGEYLQDCYDASGPSSGRNYGQICRLELGGEMDEEPIRESLAKADAREDCADFGMTGVMRMMYLYSDSPYFSSDLQNEIKTTFLNFKYYPDEGGTDDMIAWSENHNILFLSLELLAGQKWREETFPNAGLTGAEHIEKAIPRLHFWLDMRGRIGFTEWHSNVYFNEDLPALLNLVDFAEDETIRTKAAMIIDIMAFDMALNSFKGYFATAHGRTYPDKVMGLSSDSLATPHWLLFGDGASNSLDSFTATHLCTSEYALPELLERIGSRNEEPFINKQRDSIDVADAADYGLTYDNPDHVVFWWTMAAYAESHVLPGTFQTIEDWGLWDGWWSRIEILRFLVGSPLLQPASAALDPMSRGPATETANVYTYKTPEYQLSSAQDYNPGLWAGQQHIWSGTIDADATVFTSYPGGLGGDYMASDWVGGWLPRAAQYKNVIVLLYDRPYIPILESLLFKSYTHAYFPKSAFDEYSQEDGWTFGRKGDAYIALWSAAPTTWSTDATASEYELIADYRSNVWIAQMGRASDDGTYEEFKTAILDASLNVEGFDVIFDSPGNGIVQFGMDLPFTVSSETIDLGPYPRFDNIYCQREWGTGPYVITDEGDELELRFDIPRRRFFEAE